jgi:hypothetical protein
VVRSQVIKGKFGEESTNPTLDFALRQAYRRLV